MYFCLEGVDGVGKTTQVNAIYKSLVQKYGSDKVVSTSEPGNKQMPMTMKLRELMLDAQFDLEMTAEAREYISQAARSVNLNSFVYPALLKRQFIIQDRGLLSGFAYGMVCGNSKEWLQILASETCKKIRKLKPYIYDLIIVLQTNKHSECLQRAKRTKKEFKSGDNIENRGDEFMQTVAKKMNCASDFLQCDVAYVDVDDKTIEEVHDLIIKLIDEKITKTILESCGRCLLTKNKQDEIWKTCVVCSRMIAATSCNCAAIELLNNIQCVCRDCLPNYKGITKCVKCDFECETQDFVQEPNFRFVEDKIFICGKHWRY